MAASDWKGILAQLGKGSYTNDPSDPTYHNHWNSLPRQEPIEAVYAATARNRTGLLAPKQQVTVIMTPSRVYVDTPSVARVGPLARLAGRGLDATGMSSPLEFPREQVRITQPRPNRMVIEPQSGPIVTARTDALVGSPAKLSGMDQIRNLGRMFHK